MNRIKIILPAHFPIFQCLALLTLWVFVIVHAYFMNITNDEAYSFCLIHTNYIKAMLGTANTHWLNSLFMKLFSMVFGNSVLSLRFHSVIAFPFFAVAIFRLSHFIKNKYLQIAFYCCVLFNPYILDFFSLARGYGLALALQVWMVIFFIKATSATFNYKKWVGVLLLATLSIGANLSYVYSVLGIAGYFFYLLLSGNNGYSVKINTVRRIALLLSFLLILTFADLLFIKYYGHDLELGGDHLFSSVFGSVWAGSLYFADYPAVKDILTYTTFILLLMALVFFIIKKMTPAIGFLIGLPIISILVFNILFNFLFNVPFLEGRTAVQWYPLGMLAIFLFADVIAINKIAKSSKALAGVLVFFISIWHFVNSASIHFCFDWRSQAESRNCFNDLVNAAPKNAGVDKAIYNIYKNYYRFTDPDIKILPISFIKEDKTTGCDDEQLKKIEQMDIAIIYFPATMQRIKSTGIPFTILKEYALTGEKLIRIK